MSKKKEKKKMLIIGGTGFLGYHVAKKAVLKNYEVTSISKKTFQKKKIKKSKLCIFKH